MVILTPIDKDPSRYDSEMVEWKRKKDTKIHAMQIGQSFSIRTLEGVMKGDVLDYLVKGIKGEYYFVKKDIFEDIYEVV